MERLRFISLAVEGFFSITREKAVEPPKASMSSETVCMAAESYRIPVEYVNKISVGMPDIFSVMKTSGDRLRAARIKAKFKSASAAARRYGWVASTYSSHENGQTEVPTEDAIKYAKAFKVSAAWILLAAGTEDDPGLDDLLRDESVAAKRRARRLIEAMLTEEE